MEVENNKHMVQLLRTFAGVIDNRAGNGSTTFIYLDKIRNEVCTTCYDDYPRKLDKPCFRFFQDKWSCQSISRRYPSIVSVLHTLRPPGHHAEHNFCMGYCFFNNVAIAAKVAQKKWNIKRVLIVDWDIHHGNGTQHIFQFDPSVLYFSIHRFDHGNFWPGKKYSNFDFVGKEEGKGFNINVAWNKKHMNDADYIAVFQRILLPVAYEFCPELVLISGGFDSAQGDPKGLCDVTPEGYAHLTHMLMSLANGKVVLVLEGGYNLTSVAESLCSCVTTLLGDPCPFLEPLTVSDSALDSIACTVSVHSQYWRNLNQHDAESICSEDNECEKILLTT